LGEKSIKSRIVYFFLGILIPLAFVVLWHRINTVIPNDDFGEYFETGLRIYKEFQSSVWKGIQAIYLLRGWRPIFFPVLAVPVIAFTGENILLSVALSLTFIYSVFLIYSYFLARFVLPPERACLVTLFMGTIPWVFRSANTFMSELSMVTCALAAIYHFRMSNYLRLMRPTILTGLWIALGMMIRPVEFSLSFMIPIAASLIWAVKLRILTKNDVFMSASFSATALILLVAQMAFPAFLPIWFVLLILILILNLACVLAFQTLDLSLPFGITFFLCQSMIAGWWLPQSHKLREWVNLTTGIVAATYHDQGSMNTLQAIESFFITLGGYPLLIALILFALGTLFLLIQVPPSKIDPTIYKQFGRDVAFAVAMILPPTIALSLTPDIAYRRAYIGFAFLLLVVSTFAVHPVLPWRRLRTALFGSLVGGQFLILCLYIFDLNPPLRGTLLPYLGMVGFPLTGGDPSLQTFQKLQSLPLGAARVAVMSESLHAFGERPFDTSGLNVLKVKYGSSLHFGYPGQFANLKEGYKQLLEENDLVLLDVSTPPSQRLQADTPYAHLTEDLIRQWNNEDLSKVGLKPVAEFEISKARPIHEAEVKKKIILLEIHKPGTPKLSYKENIALAQYGSTPGSTTPTENGSPLSGLNDGDENTAWGSQGTLDDTIFYITHPSSYRAKEFKAVLFTMPNGAHIRDVSVVATNLVGDSASWRVIRSRLNPNEQFREKLTIPADPDRSVITIELDMTDANWGSYKTYGLACFSKSRGYARNYVAQGNGIYVRELQIAPVGEIQ